MYVTVIVPKETGRLGGPSPFLSSPTPTPAQVRTVPSPLPPSSLSPNLKLPPAHRTQSARALSLDPICNAVLSPQSGSCRAHSRKTHHVERMTAFPNNYKDPSNQQRHRVEERNRRGVIRSGQSSPGNLQFGHVPSNCTRQMPHTSSSGTSQRHEATAFQHLILTFMCLLVLVFFSPLNRG